jgi:hypothetical protein
MSVFRSFSLLMRCGVSSNSIGMGAGQHSLRQVQGDTGDWLPNGDSIPGRMENAPTNRIPEEPGDDPISPISGGGGVEDDFESLRGSQASILPVRAFSERGRARYASEGYVQRDGERSSTSNATCGGKSEDKQGEVVPRTAGDNEEGGDASRREAEEAGQIPIRESEDASEKTSYAIMKHCFLDKSRVCLNNCVAYDSYWESKNQQPCTILRSLTSPQPRPKTPEPPKVNS